MVRIFPHSHPALHEPAAANRHVGKSRIALAPAFAHNPVMLPRALSPALFPQSAANPTADVKA